jgi:hypothetical protein
MLKKHLILFGFVIALVSCSFFESKTKKEPIPEVDTIVDFKTVDAFPLFPNCKDIPSRQKQKICFQMEMSQYIYASLKTYEFNTSEILTDTVLVTLKINTEGITSLSSLKMAEATRELLPQFDSILRVSLKQLPVLEPAIKRAIPVATEFILPVILTGGS